MATISLNHQANFVYNDVTRENILTRLLITERRSVLFVGEGDFSFTVAFATLRELVKRGYHRRGTLEEYQENLIKLPLQATSVWKNITGTRYKPLCPQAEHDCMPVACKPEPDLPEVKLQCVSSAADYAGLKLQQNALIKDSAASVTEEDNVLQKQLGSLQKYCEELLKNLQFISLLPGPPVFLYGIDALAVPAVLTSDAAVIWFQCPWIPLPPGYAVVHDPHTYPLVSGFLLKLADQIQPGVYVCIGITKWFPSITDYGLEGLLGKGLAASANSTPVLKKYRFIGADDELVKKVLSFGYHHQTVHEDCDIHNKIISDHVTLIFKRRKRPPSGPV